MKVEAQILLDAGAYADSSSEVLAAAVAFACGPYVLGGQAGGTNFRAMSHQQMLAWLDEASSFYVGDAAERLKAVGDQLERIAEDLSASMRRMDWEGEGEKAFVEWATNVANSTKGLADYSKDGAEVDGGDPPPSPRRRAPCPGTPPTRPPRRTSKRR
ncbi:hypothetical protein SNARM312S_05237 [Streptomyces narbonensis]